MDRLLDGRVLGVEGTSSSSQMSAIDSRAGQARQYPWPVLYPSTTTASLSSTN